MTSLSLSDELTPEYERVYQMAPNEVYEIEDHEPLWEPAGVDFQYGLNGTLMAVIDAGGKEFKVLDLRGYQNSRFNADFLIVDENFRQGKIKGFKGIRENERNVVIGRSHYQDRFSYPSTTSRDHFAIGYHDGVLRIENFEPTNGTGLRVGNKVSEHEHEVFAERTVDAEQRARRSPYFADSDPTAPYGYYQNHPLLGRRSTAINNGVYLGGSAREAIVVNGESETLQAVYDEAFREINRQFEQGTVVQIQILKTIKTIVQKHMPYNGPKTETISRRYHNDQLVGLSEFVENRAGVCRHQGLLAAYLLERLIKDGLLQGKAGVERNTVPDFGGTHAWAIFELPNGNRLVVDPAQDFVGSKKEAEAQGRWDYRIPEEL